MNPSLLVDGEYPVGDLLARAHLGDAHRLQVGLGEAEEGVEGSDLVRLEEGKVLGEVEAEEDALEVGKLSENSALLSYIGCVTAVQANMD